MRWSFILIALIAGVCAYPTRSLGGDGQVTPRPTEPLCAACHSAEVDAWRGSNHQLSFVSADFQRSYRTEHLPYCADCHAPLRTEGGLRDVESGIGCVACHIVDEGHLAGQHGTRVATRACASCHDFDAPGSQAVLQSTAREHAVSALSSVSCEGCHMKRRGSGRDHSFRVDDDLLAGALRVEGARIQDGQVIVTVGTGRVGHRFPTGDIFRRVTLTLTALAENGDVVAGDTWHLSRDWNAHRVSLRSGEREAFDLDSRLSDAPRELRLGCSARPARVHLTVDYERGASAEGEFFEAFDAVEILDTDVSLDETR